MSGLTLDVTVTRGTFTLEVRRDARPGLGRRRPRPQRVGQVDAAARPRRPAAGRRRAASAIDGARRRRRRAGRSSRRRTARSAWSSRTTRCSRTCPCSTTSPSDRDRGGRAAARSAGAGPGHAGPTRRRRRSPTGGRRRSPGGQAQRVALARALATAPDVLLLDEPLAALDVETRETVRAELDAHLSAFDGCAVIVTHDPLDALLLADRVIVLEDGRIVQDGTPGRAGPAGPPPPTWQP